MNLGCPLFVLFGPALSNWSRTAARTAVQVHSCQFHFSFSISFLILDTFLLHRLWAPWQWKKARTPVRHDQARLHCVFGQCLEEDSAEETQPTDGTVDKINVISSSAAKEALKNTFAKPRTHELFCRRLCVSSIGWNELIKITPVPASESAGDRQLVRESRSSCRSSVNLWAPRARVYGENYWLPNKDIGEELGE